MMAFEGASKARQWVGGGGADEWRQTEGISDDWTYGASESTAVVENHWKNAGMIGQGGHVLHFRPVSRDFGQTDGQSDDGKGKGAVDLPLASSWDKIVNQPS